MSAKTGIEWTDATWNPVSGCTKVSQGCKHCYAERVFPRPYPGRVFTDVRTHENRLTQPLSWSKPRKVFVNSMSDLFHEDVPFEFIDRVFAVMSATDRHTYQILTKRPERMRAWFNRLTPDPWFGIEGGSVEVTAAICELRGKPQHSKRRGGYDNCGLDWPLRNVWLGVSVENQETADERIPLLLQTPSAVRFISCEPLLGPVDLRSLRPSWCASKIDCLAGVETTGTLLKIEVPTVSWVIAGGESGPKARPMHPDWARSLRDQCSAERVPFFFKQWGEWATVAVAGLDSSALMAPYNFPGTVVDGQALLRVGKKTAGRLLDGREHSEFPA